MIRALLTRSSAPRFKQVHRALRGAGRRCWRARAGRSSWRCAHRLSAHASMHAYAHGRQSAWLARSTERRADVLDGRRTRAGSTAGRGLSGGALSGRRAGRANLAYTTCVVSHVQPASCVPCRASLAQLGRPLHFTLHFTPHITFSWLLCITLYLEIGTKTFFFSFCAAPRRKLSKLCNRGFQEIELLPSGTQFLFFVLSAQVLLCSTAHSLRRVETRRHEAQARRARTFFAQTPTVARCSSFGKFHP